MDYVRGIADKIDWSSGHKVEYGRIKTGDFRKYFQCCDMITAKLSQIFRWQTI